MGFPEGERSGPGWECGVAAMSAKPHMELMASVEDPDRSEGVGGTFYGGSRIITGPPSEVLQALNELVNGELPKIEGCDVVRCGRRQISVSRHAELSPDGHRAVIIQWRAPYKPAAESLDERPAQERSLKIAN